MLPIRSHRRWNDWATSRTDTGRSAVIVHFRDTEARVESFTIAYTSSEYAADHAAGVLSTMYEAVQECISTASEVNAASGAAILQDVERRLVTVMERSETHTNRFRKDLEAIDSGAVHRIFHEMVRALRMCRAMIVNYQVERRTVPYVGLIRIRQYLADVLQTVHVVAKTAHHSRPPTG